MLEPESAAPSAASPSDPPRDHHAPTLPHNIAGLLHVVGILLDHGRHLAETLLQRAAAPNFNAIAACFGTANTSTIRAHLNRGLLRSLALMRFLRACATTGRDIDFFERRTRAPRPQPAQPAAAEPPTHKRAPRPTRPAGWDDPELYMPTLEELDRQVRRRPIGRTIQDICLDLGVVPGFCEAAFSNVLYDIVRLFGGNYAELMQKRIDRREAFAKEQDRKRGANWDWVNMSRDALRQVLGFFIGEPPVNPLDPAAALATAPP